MDCIGADLGDGLGADASACCAQCEATSGCNAFSWTNIIDSGHCYYKASCTSLKADGSATVGVLGGGPAPAPNSPAAIAARNFGCGHISCGWMFLIIIPLLALVTFAIAIPLNKFVLKKDSTWFQAIPLTTLGPAFCLYIYWGVRFLLCNCPGRTPMFRRWNCTSHGNGGGSGAAQGRRGDESDATYQEEDGGGGVTFDDI